MQFNVSPFKTVVDAQKWAANQIDAAAGRARTRYITTVPGQDITYQAKYADALAFIRAGNPETDLANYPWVKAEMDVLGGTATEAADFIKGGGDPWNNIIGPTIEKLRRQGKDAVSAAQEIANVVALTRAAEKLLDAV